LEAASGAFLLDPTFSSKSLARPSELSS